MQIKLIPEDFDKTTYNSAAVNPIQSWEWGEARKELGIKVVRIGEFDGDKLKRVYQITFHKIPYTNFTVAYMPRSEFPDQSAINFIKETARQKQAIFVKLEPYVEKNSLRKTLPSGLVHSTHPLFPTWTQVLDLSKSEDELLKKLKSKTRYNMRLAQKKGVIVKEESTDVGFETFSKLYFETTKRQRYHGHDHHYHKVVWNHLKKSIAHILIAYFKNTPLAAYELFHFNDVLYYPYGGTSELYRNLMASNLLMWEAIRLGKKLNVKKFDMWGSLPPDYDTTSPWAGFTRFKEGYGTEFVEFIGSYDLVINPSMYQLYNTVYRLRRILLQLKA